MRLNRRRVVAGAIDRDILSTVVDDYLDLLETSSAVYETNGDYAMGIFSSGWCRFMDAASRKLCETDDDVEALASGRWHCHESCWNEASRPSIESAAPVEVACKGGIKLYAIPIVAGDEVVGSINFGHGAPPSDPERLRELAALYEVDLEDLRRLSTAYEPRPPAIVELAKRRLETTAKLLGEIVLRQRTEAELRHSRERLQLAIEGARLGTWHWDLRTGRLMWSNTCREIFGVGSDELTTYGRFLEALHPDDRARVHDVRMRALEARTDFHAEYRVVWPDGAIRWVASSGQGFYDESATAVRMEGVVQDITERKRAEQELRDSQERLQLAIEGARLGTWHWNVLSGELDWSDRCREIFGVGPDVSMSYERFAETLHPDDRAHAADVVARALESRMDFDTEYRVVLPDGALRWVAAKGRGYYDESGAAVRMEGVAIDVTTRKEAEETLRESELRFRRLAEGLPQLVWTCTADGVCDYVNPQWVAYTGALPDEHFGTGWLEVVHPDDRERVARSAREEMRDDRKLEIEFRIRRHDGVYRWFMTQAVPIRGVDGRVVKWVGSHTDIDDIRAVETRIRNLNSELEERVRARTAELEAANRELEGFSYSVSHDLRAPLRAIDGFARILLDDYSGTLAPEGWRCVEVISRNVRRMGALIDDLLQFSRLGRNPIALQNVSLTRLMNRAYTDLLAERDGREIGWLVEEVPDCVADPILLGQVCANLLSNAIKFTRGRERARIHVGSLAREGETVYYVADNGAGFDMNFADKLFGVFQRLHRAEDYEGTGVGLALAQRIVHRHGGRIWAEAAEGKGATFFFTLGNSEDA